VDVLKKQALVGTTRKGNALSICGCAEKAGVGGHNTQRHLMTPVLRVLCIIYWFLFFFSLGTATLLQLLLLFFLILLLLFSHYYSSLFMTITFFPLLLFFSCGSDFSHMVFLFSCDEII
jgi:hypothetical protein